MMGMRIIFVDLPEDSSCLIARTCSPVEQATWPIAYRSGEGEFRSWKNTNCHAGIFRCREPASSGVEVAGGQFVVNFGRTRLNVVQAIIAHAEDLLCCLQPQPTKKRWEAPRALMLATLVEYATDRKKAGREIVNSGNGIDLRRYRPLRW